uniref:NADH-ubiquinone oxidoreductase chain 5 n=1 Tax=Coccidula rufa TaxID=115345 RepID=A0A0S2MPF1_9CUCU|nr:NADH deshydrogenase subunit 5 [Coccidula rufa]
MIICLIYFSFFMLMSVFMFIFSINFLVKDLVWFLELNLINLNSCSMEMTILLDWISLLFMSFVFFISSLVIFYSELYMEGELNLNRFILLVVMFVVSMMLMIISPNLISILLGWDGLGLVSYCLVIFYQNIKSFNAGMLTALSNRIGDVMLLMSIAWMLNFGSWNYVFYMDLFVKDFDMKIVSLLVLLAALTKSAQIPFSSWLPAAMAAPTPVSALVHSSTLVTAGVYLLIRFNILIVENYSLILLFIGLLTMFMSGLGANFEFDLKKIIALSTLSQLGLMMSILALGSSDLAFYHLLIHALFKALLFMCAGSMIHNFLNNQDIRFMGNISLSMPLTLVFFNISNMSLCGIPFFSGFYSKDLMLEFISMSYLNFFVYLIFYISIGLTVSYSFRLSYYLFMGENNFFVFVNMSESLNLMVKNMGVLFFMVVISGGMFNWLIFSTPYFIILPKFMKLLTLLIIGFGIVLGLEVSKLDLSFQVYGMKFSNLFKFMSLMWNMPFISTLGSNYVFLKSGGKILKFVDQGWMEFFGSNGILMLIKSSIFYTQYLMKNNLKIYLILIICWLILVIMFSIF